MTDLADRMEPLKDSATSEKMWTLFRDTLPMAIDCNPHKQARVRESMLASHPLLHSPFHQKEGPCLQEDAEARHRGTEGPVQTTQKRSLVPAAESILGLITTFEDADSEQATKNKLFWTYIKHQKSSNVGVAPLNKKDALFRTPKNRLKYSRGSSVAYGEGGTFTKEEFHEKCSRQLPYN